MVTPRKKYNPFFDVILGFVPFFVSHWYGYLLFKIYFVKLQLYSIDKKSLKWFFHQFSKKHQISPPKKEDENLPFLIIS
jgi:hypothetical protein